ncbi:MAG: BNR repeat-containing protein [Opitutales bacterium]|nr:BNR repeat-containing protein [Opitutales bacterium]
MDNTPLPVAEVIDVSPVWAGHRVLFCLHTVGDRQYVAFYDADRWLTVGCRRLDHIRFQCVRLPKQTAWDSHNYVALNVDSQGRIHVSGDMHINPLVYFVSDNPHDIDSFRRLPGLVGRNEERATYPQFLKGPEHEFIFTYRDGDAQDGEQIFNLYDPESRQWTRFFEQPLLTGEGRRNAYYELPLLGPDGYYHLCWVWRDSYDASSNHDLSYARSRDLRRWETGAGQTIPLPIRMATGDIVDPVPVGGGIINGGIFLGFDSCNRVVLSYHKFDAKGNTQAYNARLEAGEWRIYRTSDWDYRWWFGGGGSLAKSDVILSPVEVEQGQLIQRFEHVRYGRGRWLLDEATLQPISTEADTGPLAEHLMQVESKFPGMQVNVLADTGQRPDGRRDYLRWETLDANRDQPREGPLPEPSILRVVSVMSSLREDIANS